jgi:Flp pilus assembly protein TadG
MKRLAIRPTQRHAQTRGRADEHGQVLVLFALFIVALLGIGALVLDVARVYTLQRYERSVADAAALAGAQDLQVPNSRVVTSTNYIQARTDALKLLWRELGGAASVTPSCAAYTNTNGDVVDCPIGTTSYLVSIKTNPSPSYVNVDPSRSVQVTIRQANVPMTLARLFGQATWNVGQTSVAGLQYGAKYAIITLRPPLPCKDKACSDQNQDDISITGGTVVTVAGDVGTNTNVVISGVSSSGTTNSTLSLGPGNMVYHFDTYQAWSSPPSGKVIPNPIPDPTYRIPARIGLPADPVPDAAGCAAAITSAIADGYVGHSSSTDPTKTYVLNTSNTTCYVPGIYSTNIGKNVGNAEAILLEPGVYFFDGGLSMNGTLIGGYDAGASGTHTGVALVFPEANNVNNGAFAGNSATLVALNAGTCINDLYPDKCASDTTNAASGQHSYATPAQDAQGQSIQVPFKSSKRTILAPESIIVYPKDLDCTVQTYENTGCNDTGNNSINLPGGGNLFIAGVQYAPTDNVAVAGNASGTGYLGQIIAWTVKYVGGSSIGEVYPGGLGNGVLALDTACSGPVGFGVGGVGSGGPHFCNP